MKKIIFLFLAILFIFINCLPISSVFADSSYSSSQYANIGSLMLSNLIASGEASELDFSEYTENDGLDFLIALGELAVTGDPSGLVDQGLFWLGGELSDTYDSLIESIRDWEFSVAPNLYNWWYNGSKYEYKLIPAENSSKPLRHLLKAPDNLPTPNPDSNYLDFIAFINGTSDSSDVNHYGKDFYWKNYPQSYFNNIYNNTYRINQYPCSNYSYFKILTDSNSLTSNPFNTPAVYVSDIVDINIFSNNGVYSFYNSISPYPNVGYWNPSNPGNCIFFKDSPNYYSFGNTNSSNIYQYSGTLTQVFNYLKDNVRNVNIYVDGDPWSIVGSPTYPIVIPGTLTVLNEQPAQYTFNEPTYIDLSGLTTMITNAINNSDVLTWQDIDDYFLDINGQQAFPVVQIYRNDYDNMYIEQYPYPAKLIGMQDPLKFNEHMLDNYYGQYLKPMVDVTSNTLDVLPGEIKWVLGIGAILMIFAVIINRLLE